MIPCVLVSMNLICYEFDYIPPVPVLVVPVPALLEPGDVLDEPFPVVVPVPVFVPVPAPVPVDNVSPAIPLPEVLSILVPVPIASESPDIPGSVPYSVPVVFSVSVFESLHATIVTVNSDSNATLKIDTFFIIIVF